MVMNRVQQKMATKQKQKKVTSNKVITIPQIKKRSGTKEYVNVCTLVLFLVHYIVSYF